MNRGGRQNKHFSLMKQIFTYFFFLAFGTVLTAQVCPINNNIRNGTPKVFFTFTSEAEANYYEDTQTSGSGVSDCGGADCDNLNNAVFSGMASPSGTAFNATFDKVRDHTGTEIKFNDDLPAGVTATDFFEGTVTFNFDGGITLTCSYNASGVLPVVFADFTARSHNGTVQLDWTTATELNNDYFQVERSADGREFTALGKVNGNGNSEDDDDNDKGNGGDDDDGRSDGGGIFSRLWSRKRGSRGSTRPGQGSSRGSDFAAERRTASRGIAAAWPACGGRSKRRLGSTSSSSPCTACPVKTGNARRMNSTF